MFRQRLGLQNFIEPKKRNLAMHWTVFAKSDPTVGVQEELLTDDLIVLPNLTNQNIKIESNLLNNPNSKIKIVNALGEEVFSSLSLMGNNITLDVQNHPVGMYFITILVGTKIYTKQFIVHK